jgi:hypothetical protein
MNESWQVTGDAKKALEQNNPEEALVILDQISTEDNIETLFLKGEIYFKLQRWGEALNQFSLYLECFPEDKKATSYCRMIQNILGFYHRDLYNP